MLLVAVLLPAAVVGWGCGGRTTIATASAADLAPTTPGVAVDQELTRRGLERDYLSSPAFGAPRGAKFEDLIPVGARLSAVHVDRTATIDGIWLSYEHNGITHHTTRRGATGGTAESFRLGDREKIVGIHGYGQGGALEELVIATNQRIVSFGSSGAPRDSPPPCAQLTREQKERYVAIGITGRGDEKLRQISFRFQIRQPS
jgi:hypothetical protein